MTSKAPTERNLNEVKRRQTCDACQAVKTRCSRSRPTCARCVAQNIPCHYSVSRRIGRPRRLAPPPSPVSLLHVRRAEEQTPVASQPNSEFPCVNQPTGRFYAADWSGGVDVDLDGERMIIDGTDGSSQAMERQRSQDNRSVTPRVGRAPITSTNMAASSFSSARASGLGLNNQDLSNSFLGNADFSSSSLSSSLTNEIDVPRNHRGQQGLDDPEVDRRSLHSFGHHLEHTQFDFSPTDHELDASGSFSWEFSNGVVPPARKNACQCLESALSVTLSIGQVNARPYPSAIDLALDVEAQLREAVPLAIECSTCKSRQGEILKLFSNAMADMVDLFQQLCNAEFSISSNNDLLASERPHTSSTLDGFPWIQLKPSGRLVSNSQQLTSHDRNISGSTSHTNSTSNGGIRRRAETVSTGTAYSHELPSPPKTASGNSNTALSSWHILVGRHLIGGNDRKFLLMHLLRRRLYALSKVLEGLIRAIQDVRMAWRRVDPSSVLYDNNEALNRAAEMDARKSVKTASRLYDIIDQLEKIQI